MSTDAFCVDVLTLEEEPLLMKRQMSPGVEGGFGIFASGHSDRAVGWGEALEGVRRNGLDVVCCLKLCHDVFTY